MAMFVPTSSLRDVENMPSAPMGKVGSVGATPRRAFGDISNSKPLFGGSGLKSGGGGAKSSAPVSQRRVLGDISNRGLGGASGEGDGKASVAKKPSIAILVDAPPATRPPALVAKPAMGPPNVRSPSERIAARAAKPLDAASADLDDPPPIELSAGRLGDEEDALLLRMGGGDDFLLPSKHDADGDAEWMRALAANVLNYASDDEFEAELCRGGGARSNAPPSLASLLNDADAVPSLCDSTSGGMNEYADAPLLELPMGNCNNALLDDALRLDSDFLESDDDEA